MHAISSLHSSRLSYARAKFLPFCHGEANLRSLQDNSKSAFRFTGRLAVGANQL